VPFLLDCAFASHGLRGLPSPAIWAFTEKLANQMMIRCAFITPPKPVRPVLAEGSDG
jgi:hypothetical protein